MRSLVDVLNMPLVISIINGAESKILKLTGVPIKLNAQTEEVLISEDKVILKAILLDRYPLKWADIESKARYAELVLVREIYSWICIKILHESFSSVGRDIRKDHTSIMHYIKNVKKSQQDFPKKWLQLQDVIKEFTLKQSTK